MKHDEKQKTTICTHDGNFHADEVMACCMLLRLPEYEGGHGGAFQGIRPSSRRATSSSTSAASTTTGVSVTTTISAASPKKRME